MKINFSKIVIAGGLVGLTALTAFAGYYHSFRVTVESSDWHWSLLRVPTDRPIRIAKKLSKAPCDYGRSWGVTDRGIWTDKGCRAVFEIAGDRPERWRWTLERDRHRGDHDHEWHEWSDRDWNRGH